MTLNWPYQLTIDRSSIKPLCAAKNRWSASVKASMDDKKFIDQTEAFFQIMVESQSPDMDDIEREVIENAHHYMLYRRSFKEKLARSKTKWEPPSPLSTKPNFYTFINALDTYLCKRFKYRQGPCYQGLGHCISVDRRALSLYLRYPPSAYENHFKRPLVIAKILCGQPRKGVGTDFLRFLVSQAEDHKFETIILEAAITDEAVAFAKARGFRRDPTNPDNWFAAIEDLHLPSA